YLLNVDLLYHDMDIEFAVQYFSFKNIDRDSFFNLFSPTGQLDFFSGTRTDDLPEYFRNIHFVFSIEELARYILFRGRLAKVRLLPSD
ncbi:hypothetical protein ACFLVS_04910, partial [Chloroflexota bacterium]